MKARFKKRIKITEYQHRISDEYYYGDVIGNFNITIERDCGNSSAILEYVEEISECTPYTDSFGNTICLDDVLILNYGKDNLQKEVKVYFDLYFGIYKVKRLDGKLIDLENLASWVNYSNDKDIKGNRSGVLIKLKIFEKTSM